MFSQFAMRAIAAAVIWASVPVSWTSIVSDPESEDPLTDVIDLAEDAPTDEFYIVFPQDPTVTEFSSSYGASRPGGRRHQGNDLMAPKMTPVYAVADGVVLRTRTSPRAGAYLVIEHPDGWASWYMHLNNDTPGTDDGRASYDQTFTVQPGDFVTAGQQIGYVGDSGNAEGTGPHTHFELHKDGRSVNPYSHLAPAYERALTAVEAQRLAALLGSVD